MGFGSTRRRARCAVSRRFRLASRSGRRSVSRRRTASTSSRSSRPARAARAHLHALRRCDRHARPARLAEAPAHCSPVDASHEDAFQLSEGGPTGPDFTVCRARFHENRIVSPEAAGSGRRLRPSTLTLLAFTGRRRGISDDSLVRPASPLQTAGRRSRGRGARHLRADRRRSDTGGWVAPSSLACACPRHPPPRRGRDGRPRPRARSTAIPDQIVTHRPRERRRPAALSGSPAAPPS